MDVQTLRELLMTDAIGLHRQVVVDLFDENKPIHYEYFTNILLPGGKILTPKIFIDTAERSRLIRHIDLRIARYCVDTARLKKYKDHPQTKYFCNISPETIRYEINEGGLWKEFFPDEIRMGSLVFDINLADIQRGDIPVKRFIEKNIMQGCGFSIDNANFEKKLEIDFIDYFSYIKFDADRLIQRIRELGSPERFQSFKNTLSHAGIEIIVTRVESQDQLDFLKPFEFKFAQGFFFGRPLVIPKGLSQKIA